jgi:hypothetical protein
MAFQRSEFALSHGACSFAFKVKSSYRIFQFSRLTVASFPNELIWAIVDPYRDPTTGI